MSGTAAHPPLVAIVTPVYNGGAYFERALQCVQAQTYPNLVHVIRDNASTDGTAELIARYQNGRVPIITERGATTVPATPNWNAAVALAPKTAKYFQIFCADDEIDPTATEKMVAVAESDPAIELVGCIRRENDTVVPSTLPPGQTVFEGRDIVARYLDKRGNELPHTHGLYRAHAEEIGGEFFPVGEYMADSDACMRVLTRGKFGFVHEPLFMMRLHEDSITARVVSGNKARLSESLRMIERWGPKVMDAKAFEACRNRHLRAIYRYMMAWRVMGKGELYERFATLVRAENAAPSPADYAISAVEWPVIVAQRQARRLLAGLA